jgi:hypothetical protein
MKNENFETETNITICNEQTKKKKTIEFSDTQNIIKKHIENVEFLEAYELLFKKPLQTSWNEHGGCLVNLSENQILTMLESLMVFFQAMINSSDEDKKEMAKTVNLQIICDLKSLL